MISALLMALVLQVDWATSRNDQGWTRVSRNSSQLIYLREGPSPSRVWSRLEWREATSPRTMSSVELYEVDCETSRLRSLQGSAYEGPNLTGPAQAYGGGDWFYPVPDSLGDAFLLRACALADTPSD